MRQVKHQRRAGWRLKVTSVTLKPSVIKSLPQVREALSARRYAITAGVLLRKSRSYAEVYNDLGGEIVNVFKQLRDNGPELKQVLILTLFARKEFELASLPAEDPLEQARRTIVKSFMGFGSDAIRRPSGFRANSNRSGTTPAHDWRNYADTLDNLIERIRGVVIECRDYRQVIAAHDSPETLFYVDPPYVHATRTSAKRYIHEMANEEHQALSELLHSVQGKVVLSGYKSVLYDDLYSDWHQISFAAYAQGKAKGHAEQFAKDVEEADTAVTDMQPKGPNIGTAGNSKAPSTDTLELNKILRIMAADLIVALNEKYIWSVDKYEAQLLDWKQRTATYNTKVADNCRLVANAEMPAEWTDPATGKKLYNEAAVKRTELEAREEQIMQDALSITLEFDIDEEKVIVWREQQLAELAALQNKLQGES